MHDAGPVAAVHQFVASFTARDAVSRHAQLLQRTFRALGLDSEIYADRIGRGLGRQARPYLSYAPEGPAAQRVHIYHLATGSPVADTVSHRPEKLVVNYHNLTPAKYFVGWDDAMVAELERGERQARRLAARADATIADSTFNAEEFAALGASPVAVVPVLADRMTTEATGQIRPVHRDLGVRTRRARWLFVGRLTPNKAQDRLVRALAVAIARYDDQASLDLVGGPSPASYGAYVRQVAKSHKVAGRVRIHGSIGHTELANLYLLADVFVSASQHEGFGIPLVEAMATGLPVVATDAGAVAETVGDAGLMLPDDDPETLAAAVHTLSTNPEAVHAMRLRGFDRVTDLDWRKSRVEFVKRMIEMGTLPAGFGPRVEALSSR